MTTSGYQLRRISEPETEPFTLEDAKGWVNLDADITKDDVLLTRLIKAAREWAEKETNCVFVDSIFELRLNDFHGIEPWGREIVLPVQPLISVIDVRYINNDGEYATLPTTDWIEVADEPPRIVGNPTGTCWPALCPRPGAVLVTFRAGYETAGSPQDASNIPESIKTAMQMMVSHWYEHREAVSTDHRNTPTEIPLGARVLLDPYRRIL